MITARPSWSISEQTHRARWAGIDILAIAVRHWGNHRRPVAPERPYRRASCTLLAGDSGCHPGPVRRCDRTGPRAMKGSDSRIARTATRLETLLYRGGWPVRLARVLGIRPRVRTVQHAIR